MFILVIIDFSHCSSKCMFIPSEPNKREIKYAKHLKSGGNNYHISWKLVRACVLEIRWDLRTSSLVVVCFT